LISFRDYVFFKSFGFNLLLLFAKMKRYSFNLLKGNLNICILTFFFKERIKGLFRFFYLKKLAKKEMYLRKIFCNKYYNCYRLIFTQIYNVFYLYFYFFKFYLFENKTNNFPIFYSINFYYCYFSYVMLHSIKFKDYLFYLIIKFFSIIKIVNNINSILYGLNLKLLYDVEKDRKIKEILLRNNNLNSRLFNEFGDFNVRDFSSDKKSKFFLKTQKSRLKIFNNLESFLFGYKLNFVGRYSRKQRSSNFWFSEGGVPSASISLNVDYGSFSINLANSRCTIKVWLYKNRITPVYKTKFW